MPKKSLWDTYRTVVEEPKAQKSVDRLTKEREKFAKQWEGFTWLVARTPEEISRPIKTGNVEYRLAHREGDNKARLSDIAVLYTFDGEEVKIIDVNAWDKFDKR